MKVTSNLSVTGEGYGYVYVMSYPHSDKVKIGHTLNPTARAVDIGGTLAPETPTLEAYFWCAERREAVERAAHKIEHDTRYNGEWFCVSVERAMAVIKQAAENVEVQITLAYDRNEWESKAAAELEARLQAILQMDDETLAARNKEIRYLWSCGKSYRGKSGKLKFKDYEPTEEDKALMDEFDARQPRWNEEARARAAESKAISDARLAAADERARLAKVETARLAAIESKKTFKAYLIAAAVWPPIWVALLIAGGDAINLQDPSFWTVLVLLSLCFGFVGIVVRDWYCSISYALTRGYAK